MIEIPLRIITINSGEPIVIDDDGNFDEDNIIVSATSKKGDDGVWEITVAIKDAEATLKMLEPDDNIVKQ